MQLTPEDEQRIMEASQRDTNAFAPLYEMYFPRIYAYCARRTDTAQEAEDLTSTVFIKALRAAGTYKGGSVAAWLFRIAHNELANYWRGKRPQVSLEAHQIDLPADTAPPGTALMQEEEAKAVRQAVSQLPPDQQNLLALKLNGQLTSQQIGEIIGKSASAVRVELHRIMKVLRVMVEKEELS